MNSFQIALIPLLPLASFLLLALFGKSIFKNASGIVGTTSLLASTFLSFINAYQYFFVYGKVEGVYQQFIAFKYTWLKLTPDLIIDMGAILDPISMMMLIVVTFVSLMVHIYSLGYMKGEDRYPTYYSYLSLFTFSMLGLVLASNIFQIYIFWELVGVSSFLLIGFYFDRPSAVAASKKAFIVTRFADLGFLIGILVLSFYAETLDFQTLIHRLIDTSSPQLQSAIGASFIGASALTWGLVLVFIGGAGKSAMFPLHIWLPDAMEGPTPVSALIHAATMVVAGVYLVARLFPVFAISCPAALEVVAYTGAVSALFAAVIACTQTDIKRVLAYSTMSQIGFMMFALGVSQYGGEKGLGFSAAMFHLFTHAMFKALLFLGAGAVIHYIHSNEMKDMGGLAKKMPITHITFLIACLAISGVPPFSGFFSKEEILLAASHHNTGIYILALITSCLTAFYMFRLYFSIFHNKSFSNATAHHATDTHHAHGEGGMVMMLPLILLAVAAAAAGFIPFGSYVSSDGFQLSSEFHIEFAWLPIFLSITGIAVATSLYFKKNDKPERISNSIKTIYTTVYNKFYVDELYTSVTKGFLFNVLGSFAAWFDKNIVDGMVNTSATVAQTYSEGISGWQSGKVQGYAIWFIAGALGFALLFIYFIN